MVSKPAKCTIVVDSNDSIIEQRNTVIHEVIHLLQMFLDGVDSKHTKKFWRMVHFLAKEFKCDRRA